MKITKLGHCCLLIEENGLRILTDPGSYSTAQDNKKDIDIILITHEHNDHLHIPSLKIVLSNNPQVRILTNKGVAKLLEEEKIKYELLEDGQKEIIKNVLIEAMGCEHAPLYRTCPCVNTGFFINNRLFYPGDSLYKPSKKVELLALPVAGPWLKLQEAIDYAIMIKPRIAFPVHDGILKKIGTTNSIPAKILPEHNIQFKILEEERETEI